MHRKSTPQLLMMLNSLLQYEESNAIPECSNLQQLLIGSGKENLGVCPQFIATFLKHQTAKQYCSVENLRVLTLVGGLVGDEEEKIR